MIPVRFPLESCQSREDSRSFQLIPTEKAVDLAEYTYMEYYKTMESIAVIIKIAAVLILLSAG